MNNDYFKICYEIARQDKPIQSKMMEFIKSNYTEEEYNCIAIGVSYCRLFLEPGLKEAMMDAISSELYAMWKK